MPKARTILLIITIMAIVGGTMAAKVSRAARATHVFYLIDPEYGKYSVSFVTLFTTAGGAMWVPYFTTPTAGKDCHTFVVWAI